MKTLDKILVLLILWLALGGGLPSFIAPQRPTAAVYVYEKDSGGVPPAVTKAIGKLNDDGIMASTHEDDGTNAMDKIPAQYRLAVPAAREAGLPALVVQAGDKVLRTVKDPTTEQAVLEAVQ